jgi:L-lysine 2,3-aminomutase
MPNLSLKLHDISGYYQHVSNYRLNPEATWVETLDTIVAFLPASQNLFNLRGEGRELWLHVAAQRPLEITAELERLVNQLIQTGLILDN